MGSGPLAGVRVAEFAGLGPTPFAGMMLADLGADVLCIKRDSPAPQSAPAEWLDRGRRRMTLNLKEESGRDAALAIVAGSDVLLEGFRPGVMERLGLSPAVCLGLRPALVYARMTGWGQHGRDAGKAGHDINYLARAGALWPLGEPGSPPPPPLNLVGDFGGGGMLVVVGILAALLESRASGVGQIVDAAMVDGAALLTTQLHGWIASGFWREARRANVLDGACYFYRAYETADGEYMAVGAIEPQFHAALITGLGLAVEAFDSQMDPAHWPARSALIESRFRTRTRADWDAIFAPLDACVTPVLRPSEAVADLANQERRMFTALGPAAAPRFTKLRTEKGPEKRLTDRQAEHTHE